MKRAPKSTHPSALPAALENEIAASLAPIAPKLARRAAMRSALLARVRADASTFVTVRGSDAVWVPLAPKVAIKMLDDDGATQSFLLRFEPGGRFEAHHHAGDELCFVLQGDFRLGDIELLEGDYHVARGGTRHDAASSRSGCLLFIRVPSGAMPYG